MFEFIVIIICLLINAVLAGSETAFIAVSKPTIKALVKQGHENARLILQHREKPERMLSIIQIVITFVGAFAVAIRGAGAEESISSWLSQRFVIGGKLAEVIAVYLIVIPLTYASVALGGTRLPIVKEGKVIGIFNSKEFFVFKKLVALWGVIMQASYFNARNNSDSNCSAPPSRKKSLYGYCL